MKKFIALAVIMAIVFSVASPSFAQRGKGIPPKPAQTSLPAKTGASVASFADFETIDAISDGKGVVVRWTMRTETRVAGYRVYRISGKGKQLIHDRIVPGSFARSKDDAVYGEQYSDLDENGDVNSSYVVEALSIDGPRLSSAETPAKYRSDASSLVANAETAVIARDTNGSIETFSPVATTPLNAAAPNPVNQRWVASQAGAKIGVKNEGFYRVTRAELQAAGFNLASSSANWRLFMEGNEQAIIVGPGDQYIEFYGKGIDTVESDTRMYYLIADTTPGSRYAERTMRSFGGTVLANNSRAMVTKKERTLYVSSILNGDVDNYWGTVLTSGLSTIRFTVPNPDLTATANATLNVKIMGYSFTNHQFQVTLNGHPLSTPVTGVYQESFAADIQVPSSFLVDGTNSLQLAATTGSDICLFDTVSLTYQEKFRAYQNQASFVAPIYKKVDLGGFSSPTVSTVTITDASQAVISDTPNVPASSTPGLLRMSSPTYIGGEAGSGIARLTVSRVFGNTGVVTADLTLTNGTATGGASCGSGVDYVFPSNPTLTFGSGVVSQNVDVQLCNDGIADSGETFTAALSNATGGAILPQPSIRVLDLSYEDSPRMISGLPTTQSGSTYGVTIPSQRGGNFYAVDESYIQQSSSVTANTPSTLSTPGPGADVIIISYSAPDFMAAANAWASYRRTVAGGSFTVKVVDVADIYDEFNYGVTSPLAIKSFLNYAYASQNYQTVPKYVLLLGDGSYDPRNYEGSGAWNLVPTRMVNLIYAESGSDEALADFNNDGLAEMPIGRIPARTAEEISLALSKTQGFENAQMQSFARGAVFANDGPDGYDFQSMNQIIRNELPPAPTMQAIMVSRGSNPGSTDPNAQAALLNALGTGPYIVNYAGHGSGGLWASPDFFGIPNVAQIAPSNQSIYTMLTCLNGYFIRPNAACLAETLLKSTGRGAVVAWASAEKTTPDIQLIMGQRFYNQLNAGTLKRMGDLVRDAKLQIPGGSDVRFSWALLGDPALQVRQ